MHPIPSTISSCLMTTYPLSKSSLTFILLSDMSAAVTIYCDMVSPWVVLELFSCQVWLQWGIKNLKHGVARSVYKTNYAPAPCWYTDFWRSVFGNSNIDLRRLQSCKNNGRGVKIRAVCHTLSQYSTDSYFVTLPIPTSLTHSLTHRRRWK